MNNIRGNNMNRSVSPLRYPGGKTRLYPLVLNILKDNGLEGQRYAEPFAGGCGLALALLYGEHVRKIHINDIDKSIWSFWHSVLNHTEELIDRIQRTSITIEEWHIQREIHRKMNRKNPVELGFATLFLNRVNRSGIIKSAGPIGGRDQSGPYKMDCRFNRETLIQRIVRVAKYRNRIHLTCYDALKFINKKKCLPNITFFYVDPPYFNKGPGLYTNFYEQKDHVALANMILSLRNPWIVTYDDVADISRLYRNHKPNSFTINYSLQTKKRATEILFASKRLVLLSEIGGRKLDSKHCVT